MTAAFKAQLNHTHKFVLVALCDNANDQGECYPSISMLCEKTSLSDRAVQKSISYLVEAKYIKRDIRNGRSTYYYINDPRTWFTPEECSPPNVVHPTPEPRSPPPPNVVHPTPEPRSPITINEPSIESSGNHQGVTLPDWLPPDDWNRFCAYRLKASGKKWTKDAEILNLGKLVKFQAQGQDPVEVINESIANGWSGLFALKQPSRASPSGNSQLGKAGQATAAAAQQWLESANG